MVLYRALPLTATGKRDLAAAPASWKPSDSIIRHAVSNGQVMPGMRLEDVVLAVGVPVGLYVNHHFMGGPDWTCTHAGFHMKSQPTPALYVACRAESELQCWLGNE